jgi:hypothetical protein
MATSSIGQIVVLNDEMADRIIAAQERVDANPPKPPKLNVKWANLDQIFARSDMKDTENG